MFLPIKTGFKILALFYISDCIMAFAFCWLVLKSGNGGIDVLKDVRDPIYFGPTCFATACELINSMIFIRWLRNDNRITRDGLILATYISIICCIVCGFTGIFAVWLGIPICIYFSIVAKRFAEQPI